MIEKKGAHTFVIVMSTELARNAAFYDLWMRTIIALLGTIAVAGYGLAWRSLEKTSELQLRLVRASELNLHLKELNLAAAGLAHETRNPSQHHSRPGPDDFQAAERFPGSPGQVPRDHRRNRPRHRPVERVHQLLPPPRSPPRPDRPQRRGRRSGPHLEF